MNAIWQRALLLLRLLLALVVGVVVWQADGLLPALAWAALLFWFWVPPLMLGTLMLRGLAPGRTTPRPAWLALLGAALHEAWVCEWVFSWRQPWAASTEPDWLPAQSRARGVLLLHGFCCNRGLWNRWLSRLRQRGHPVMALTLEPAFGSIDRYAPAIDQAIAALTHSAGGLAPVVVAHSMGGLAIRAWWRYAQQRSSGTHVARVITLGTPHQGTLTAELALARNAREMRRQSAWLKQLAADEQSRAEAMAAQFECYYSHADQVVCPAETALLPGAAAHHLPACGHLALLERPEPWAALLAALNEKSAPT
ncbi:alpha/beta fold hydrolase [Paucibacter sp. APW11]|uniref:Alpha/beta fold hydrolase n=1 Tax=Roseateles aquae TaxID=3077235 RepID=A0ABU3PIF8_9BURK|nr:alpha/beta fold hydrolase [Paucibacter sp. APW11]MDT9002349.1 alpha/beta fold hydrolase [Paucibacter sp. APW11]